MSTWRRKAIEFLPEHRKIIDCARTPMTLWIELHLRLEDDYHTQRYVYVPGSARDAVGNFIPENNTGSGGGPGGHVNYYYPGTNAGLAAGDEMIGHFRGMGVRISVPDGVQLNNGFILACTATPNGSNCVVMPVQG